MLLEASLAEPGENQNSVELERVNAELSDSLMRCQELLEQCRSKLAANAPLEPQANTKSI